MDAANVVDFFVESGCEYYAAARFTMHAQRSSLICGNLFHRAVEMLLKAGLAKKGKSLSELKNSYGHSLEKLWQIYKADYSAANLQRHDKTIDRLDGHEDIRYPRPDLHSSIGVSVQWSGEPPKTSGEAQFAVIDDLVADISKTTSWNPGSYMGTNEAGLEAIKRGNKHAVFLTTVMSPSGAKP